MKSRLSVLILATLAIAAAAPAMPKDFYAGAFIPAGQQKQVSFAGWGSSTNLLKPESFETLQAFVIEHAGKMVVSVKPDGSVEYGEGFTAGPAAKVFWEELSKAYPGAFASPRVAGAAVMEKEVSVPAGQTLSGQHSVTLAWVDGKNPAGVTYTVYRATGLCSGTPTFSKLATAVTVLAYTDSTVTPGNYCYQVTASVSSVESAPSNQAAAAVPSFPPTSLAATVQ